MADKPLIHFIHGKESGPWGSKIVALAEIARKNGLDVESLDYSSTYDLDTRVSMLVASCEKRMPVYLVGSSMGAWVAIKASRIINARALFLMAPAVGIEGYPPCSPGIDGENIEIVHGWRDPLIPAQNAIDFAREYACTLHLVDDEHRLKNRIDQLGMYFESFLVRMAHR